MSEQILQQILNEIKGLNTRFGKVEGDVTGLKTDIGQLKTDIGQLKTDIGQLKTDVGQLKTDVGQLKTDVGNLQAGQTELFQMVTALKHGQDMTHAKLEALTLDVRRLEGNFIRLENKWENDSLELHGDIRFLNHRIANVEMDIERLKNR